MKLHKTVLAAAILAGLLILILGISPAQGAPAQEANILNNGSMEGDWYMYNNDGDMRYVPSGWTPWYNLVDNGGCDAVKPHFEREAHPTHVKDGTFSARYWTAHKLHDGGLMQTVNATPGTSYKFSIYALSWSIDKTEDNQVMPDNPSNSDQGMQVGIDPAGGTNAMAGTVVWSPEVFQNDTFVLLTIEATASADKITVFTRTRPRWCVDRNDSFWDQGSLVATGQGVAPTSDKPAGEKTAAPPTQSSSGPWGVQAGSIVTATPQPDGSIIHTVASGESCTGIVVAYNITLDEFYALNGLDNDKCRFISPGQQLTIRPPQEPTPVPATPTPEQQEVAEVTSEVAAPAQNGTICVMGYEDSNSNRSREPGEDKLAGMIFEVNNGTEVIATYTTTGSEPKCFNEVPPGSYVVSWTGEGFSPTNEQSWTVDLEPGTTLSREFGALSGGAASDADSVSGPSQSGGLPTWAMALLLAVGVMLLLSGIGVAGYFVLMRRAEI
ncbi:MAG: LysM peptidoglycan-binding domain-containing protein [Anaerolineae bacterium]|nr:LysM peptidoglycan-binding domain-containing protein [Anaerolineae bacterium]